MASVLLCSPKPLEDLLSHTLLWRDDVERHAADSASEAERLAKEREVDIVVVDRDLPSAMGLIQALRRDPQTRKLAIVILADGDLEPVEIELLSLGAWAILRLPPDADWDERLARLMSVPARKDVRFEVSFELETRDAGSVNAALGTALNLSVRGMLIESAFPLQLGDVIDLRFRLPEAEGAVVGCGRVVRLAGKSRFGIEFYGLEGQGAEEIEQFVNAR